MALLLSACGEPSAPISPDGATSPGPEIAAPAPALATAEPVAARSVAPWKPTPLLVPTDARDALLLQAVEAEQRGYWYGDKPLGALDLFVALALVDPPMTEAVAGRERVVRRIAARFKADLLAGRLDAAEDLDAVLDAVRPDESAARDDLLSRARIAANAVALGSARRETGHWLAPVGDSAVFHYRAALKVLPGFEPARAGLDAIARALLQRAESSAHAGDFAAAEADLRRADRLGMSSAAVQDAHAALAQARALSAAQAIEAANAAIERLDLPQAAHRLAEARAADPQASGLDALAERLGNAHRYGHFLPGQRFADTLSGVGGVGPAMVVVPHGSFIMGAGGGEPGARVNEGPPRELRFERGFAMAVYETTVAEFARFVEATGYRTTAERTGRSSVYDERGGAMLDLRGAHWRRDYQGRRAAAATDPVLHVSFDDAQAYAEWLSANTGQRYRLPSEAEFEYVLRGGSRAPWAWDEVLPRRVLGNLAGAGDRSPNGRRWGRSIPRWSDDYWGPAPVGRYPAEIFGTHDLIGNVSEWVEDCWHDSYRRGPDDGRAWVNPGCRERVVRGGSWASTLNQARSAFRLQVPVAMSSARVGFRVARDL